MASEAELLQMIRARCAVRDQVSLGIGDDAAVLDVGGPVVVAHDMLVQDVHFRTSTASLGQIGAKALTVNVSDLAAMGARPVAAVVGLGVPGHFDAGAVAEIYDGLEAVAARHAMTIAGGDISRADALTLGVTVIGTMPQGVSPVRRSEARAGDGVFVSGPLGGAAAGFALLEHPDLVSQQREMLVSAHLCPVADVALGGRLAAAGAHAMMDCSDGLALDLTRLAAESGVAIDLELSDVPLTRGVDAVASQLGTPADEFAATGGEDYVLIVCLDPHAAQAFPELTLVGRVRDGSPGLRVLRNGVPASLTRLGWEH